ncbi:uncharacterized protein DUF4124 [Plasticicumulans lactativorans]|uniref:Uncharacterized protein DUF4124 n=1 Tax=Plasticicumulans lactativorans TaxID=1133106 RepID=A0A4R2KSJ5_9GAMM|nr:DUF4124 domain-containing protein [Plasticicumulans lactativorans]TCO77331.1 uncharacterized protein DUF4124 [Plasticicumulans lactativorans]
MSPLRVFPLLLVLQTTAVAEVYQWTDAAGRVHYGSTPPADRPARVVEVPAAPAPAPDAGATLEAQTRQLLRDADAREARDERERRARAAAAAKAREQRQRRCDAARAQLEEHTRAVAERRSQGYTLREIARLEARAATARERVREHCD